ncbi:unnamed protein product [Nesidiocoris tenuis]|uniref:Uncharacterized protein n=1 Tax=Nesidiocoris tenuis TaxID=355587 RepID=A0A6H5G449_9HEMI|nr:unnamed protein product [Nesidiocoris tenuis]
MVIPPYPSNRKKTPNFRERIQPLRKNGRKSGKKSPISTRMYSLLHYAALSTMTKKWENIITCPTFTKASTHRTSRDIIVNNS